MNPEVAITEVNDDTDKGGCDSPSQVQDVTVEMMQDDVEIDCMMTIAMMTH